VCNDVRHSCSAQYHAHRTHTKRSRNSVWLGIITDKKKKLSCIQFAFSPNVPTALQSRVTEIAHWSTAVSTIQRNPKYPSTRSALRCCSTLIFPSHFLPVAKQLVSGLGRLTVEFSDHTRARAHTHTHTHIRHAHTAYRTPLNKRSARRRGRYLRNT
jgi:hypothetical protein